MMPQVLFATCALLLAAGPTCAAPHDDTVPVARALVARQAGEPGVGLKPTGCTWGDWSAWSRCSAKCGQSTQTRVRKTKTVLNFAGLAAGLKPCVGPFVEKKACALTACISATCAWGAWSAWGPCSVTCGLGTSLRTRGGVPIVAGATCSQTERKPRFCSPKLCPKACKWSDWSGWSQCSATCGADAVKTRTRTQTPAANGGAPCTGTGTDSEKCGLAPCSNANTRADACGTEVCGANMYCVVGVCACREGFTWDPIAALCKNTSGGTPAATLV